MDISLIIVAYNMGILEATRMFSLFFVPALAITIIMFCSLPSTVINICLCQKANSNRNDDCVFNYF